MENRRLAFGVESLKKEFTHLELRFLTLSESSRTVQPVLHSSVVQDLPLVIHSALPRTQRRGISQNSIRSLHSFVLVERIDSSVEMLVKLRGKLKLQVDERETRSEEVGEVKEISRLMLMLLQEF